MNTDVHRLALWMAIISGIFGGLCIYAGYVLDDVKGRLEKIERKMRGE